MAKRYIAPSTQSKCKKKSKYAASSGSDSAYSSKLNLQQRRTLLDKNRKCKYQTVNHRRIEATIIAPNTLGLLKIDILKCNTFKPEICSPETKWISSSAVGSSQASIPFHSVSKHLKDGLLASAIILLPKRESLFIIWLLLLNPSLLNLSSNLLDKSSWDKPELYLLNLNNLLDKSQAVVVLVKVSHQRNFTFKKMVTLQEN